MQNNPLRKINIFFLELNPAFRSFFFRDVNACKLAQRLVGDLAGSPTKNIAVYSFMGGPRGSSPGENIAIHSLMGGPRGSPPGVNNPLSYKGF